jgi:hypothetical protein
MEDVAVVAGLSQSERVVDAFVAPTKTFADILRNTSWWLPFVLLVVVGFVFNVAVDKKVGFDQVAQQQMAKNKMQTERIDSLPPDQKAAVMRTAAKQTRYFSYGSAVFILIFALLTSLLWWLTINFGFGASTTFGQMFAVWMYAALPKVILYAICAGLLFAGVGIDTFDIQNPLGTNPAYYMADAGAGLKVALSFSMCSGCGH